MPRASNFIKAFESLREQYAQQLPGKVAALESSLAHLKAAPANRALLETFHRQVHSLTGSGASYGYSQLSQTARALEVRLKRAISSPTALHAADLGEVERLLDAVKHSAAIPDSAAASALAAEAESAAGATPQRRLALFEKHDAYALTLASQLAQFGYATEVFQDPQGLLAWLGEERPEALILGVAGPDDIAALRSITARANEVGVPLVFASSQTDLETRLQAVRAGGAAFLDQPADAAGLVDQLNELGERGGAEPYRVLVIEGEGAEAARYASALDSAGMLTRIVENPALTLRALQEFNPELVLLDMCLPNLGGDELARVIRQQPTCVSIPLVLLAAEADMDKRLSAMRDGADDFLAKPVDLQHLGASVTARAQRYRTLRSFMQRDSLTGLLNHTKSKEFLEVEVARAERQHCPLSFAMVDIDHFKHLNDAYGHPAGDQVIKGLARLLQERLRRSDVIGRHGGEEFAVILANTPGETAARVMDELRDAFSRIQHSADGAEFTATVSCGVATLRPGMSSIDLANEADKALYQAKRRGRNQVVLA